MISFSFASVFPGNPLLVVSNKSIFALIGLTQEQLGHKTSKVE